MRRGGEPVLDTSIPRVCALFSPGESEGTTESVEMSFRPRRDGVISLMKPAAGQAPPFLLSLASIDPGMNRILAPTVASNGSIG